MDFFFPVFVILIPITNSFIISNGVTFFLTFILKNKKILNHLNCLIFILIFTVFFQVPFDSAFPKEKWTFSILSYIKDLPVAALISLVPLVLDYWIYKFLTKRFSNVNMFLIKLIIYLSILGFMYLFFKLDAFLMNIK